MVSGVGGSSSPAAYMTRAFDAVASSMRTSGGEPKELKIEAHQAAIQAQSQQQRLAEDRTQPPPPPPSETTGRIINITA